MTNELKYIIVDHVGLEAPVVFSELFKHNEIENRAGYKIISAGICKITIGEDGKANLSCNMGSTSLHIEWDKQRENADYILLKTRLFSDIY